MVAEHVIGQPGGARGDRDNGVEPVRGERPVQRLPGPARRLGPGSLRGRVRRVPAGGLGLEEDLLAEAGETSFRPDLGYTVPPGSWSIQVPSTWRGPAGDQGLDAHLKPTDVLATSGVKRRRIVEVVKT